MENEMELTGLAITELAECDCPSCMRRDGFPVRMNYSKLLRAEARSACNRRSCRKNGCDCDCE